MSFAQFPIDARLRQGVAEMDFTTPTPIQVAAIPPALQGHDILGSAETGTGKTAAFLLPIMHKLLTTPRKKNESAIAPRVLVLVPTSHIQPCHTAKHPEGQMFP